MSDELLSNENKFYELNVELERKSKEIMKEVNSVVNTRLTFDTESLYSSSSSRLTNSIVKSRINNVDNNKICSKLNIKDLVQSKKDDDYCDQDIIFDKSNNGVRTDAVIRFFKSKSKILETELEAIKLEYKKKCDYSGELLSENKKIDEERVKYHGQLTTLKETVAKIETVNNAQLTSLQRTESENTALKKEIEGLKKELKTVNQNSSGLGLRLNRSLEENDRLRKALKCSQIDEKELREDNRKLEEEKKLAITSMEKQRGELIHAFKKQILLVDNLRRQKAHLEASILMKYTEEELLKLLDWKLDQV